MISKVYPQIPQIRTDFSGGTSAIRVILAAVDSQAVSVLSLTCFEDAWLA